MSLSATATAVNITPVILQLKSLSGMIHRELRKASNPQLMGLQETPSMRSVTTWITHL